MGTSVGHQSCKDDDNVPHLRHWPMHLIQHCVSHDRLNSPFFFRQSRVRGWSYLRCVGLALPKASPVTQQLLSPCHVSSSVTGTCFGWPNLQQISVRSWLSLPCHLSVTRSKKKK